MNQNKQKRTFIVERRPIENDAYYTIKEITAPDSPYRVASASTVFRALKSSKLKANYLGRAIRLQGASIHAWLSGEEVTA